MQVRRILKFVEETRLEAAQVAEPPLHKAAVAAVVDNPCAGRYVADLQELIDASVPIAEEISATAIDLLPAAPQSYGKAAVVGTSGEQEHGVAMLTTVFGNALRAAAGGGKAWISSMTKRAAPGGTVDVPLAHKDALFVRSHYDGISLYLPDCPLPDEIVVICAYASRGRPNHRVGGPSADQIKGEDGLT